MSSSQANQASNDIQYIHIDTKESFATYEVTPGKEIRFTLEHWPQRHGVPQLEVSITQKEELTDRLFGSAIIYCPSTQRVRSDASGVYRFSANVPDSSTDVPDSSKRHDPREPIQGSIVVNPGK